MSINDPRDQVGDAGRTVLFPGLWCLLLLDLSRSDLFPRWLEFLLLLDHLFLLWYDSDFGFGGRHENKREGEGRGCHVMTITVIFNVHFNFPVHDLGRRLRPCIM